MNVSERSISWTKRNPKAQQQLKKIELWNRIVVYFKEKYGNVNLPPTNNGETQASGKIAEAQVASVLKEMGLTWKQAGSQQSKDFKNVGNTGLDIEVKKTDSNIVTMNDTRPDENIYYIIFCTAANIKSKQASYIFANGEELINSGDMFEKERALERIDAAYQYIKEVIKQEAHSLGNLTIYPRLKHSIKIKDSY